MKKNLKVFVKGAETQLTEKNYKTEGGEGAVYRIGDIGYKIYHDPQKMIPEAKIQELGQLKMDNVLGPQEVIYDPKRTPIGFTMKFKDNADFLKKLFVKSFKNKNGISEQDIVDLIVRLQESLENIHKHDFIVADYNELNILMGDKFTIPYHIDVDSWQTKNFRATAIMETVRDPSVPFGTFSKLTDWYAWGVITFQLYTGLHPFRDGRHPDYKPRDWQLRLKDQISVFDKGVKLPSFCSNFSMIPKNQLGWYQEIFLKGKRDVPPQVTRNIVGQMVSQVVVSQGNFVVELLHTYDDSIRNVFYFEERYAITNSSIYCNNKKVFTFQSSIKNHKVELAVIPGRPPVIGFLGKEYAGFLNLAREEISEIRANDMMSYNGAIYTIYNGELVQHTFEAFGKTIHHIKAVCNIHDTSCQVFPGCVIQNILGSCWIAVPYKIGFCTNIHIKELDGRRIIDAAHNNGIIVTISEKSGKYYRTIIQFNSDFDSYGTQEEETTLSSVNFIRLPTGVCVLSGENKLLLFQNVNQKKEILNPPFSPDMTLYNENMQVQFADGEKLYAVSMKG